MDHLCLSSNLILQQSTDSKPTLLHKRHNTVSRPDLTFVSADMQERISTKVLDDIGSDHRPTKIVINIGNLADTKRKTFWNFRKADWKGFASTLDDSIGHINTLDGQMEDVANAIEEKFLEAARKTIPRGSYKKYKPFWTKELQDAVSQRRVARKQLEKEASANNKINYNRLTAKVRYLTRTGRRKKWQETCEKLDLNREGHKAWKLLNNLEGTNKKENPKPFIHEGQKVTNGKKKADIFNTYLAGVSKSTRRKHLDKALWTLFKRKRNSPTSNNLPFEKDFTLRELHAATRKAANKKAPGPDNIHNEMITHMGPVAKQKLLDLINRTWKEGQLPTSWRTARITPILKKGKPAGLPQSYRPVSLTSSFSKMAERMINDRLYHWLERNKIIDNSQAGFRKGCRTEDQLFRFVQSAIDGFQKGQTTTAVFIDLQQAYDRVWRKGLLIRVHQTPLGLPNKPNFFL